MGTRIGVAIALALCAAATQACSQSFECAADDHCERDGQAGFCESVGHCSFTDEDCASGRRFGELAGTLSSMCVPPSEGESGSGTDSNASGSETQTDPPDMTTTSTATSSPPTTSEGTSSTSDNATDPSPTESSETESTGTPPIPDCTPLFADDFDGTELEATWFVVAGDPVLVGVQDSQLQFTSPPDATGAVEYTLTYALGGMSFDLANGHARMAVDEAPTIAHAHGTMTVKFDDDDRYLWLFEGGNVRAAGNEVKGLYSEDFDADSSRYFEIGVEPIAGGMKRISWSVSEDGRTYTEVAAVERDGSLSADVAFSGGYYDSIGIEQTFKLDSIEICGQE